MINAGGKDLSIHLNRPIRWAADPSALPASAHPQVWFTIFVSAAQPGEAVGDVSSMRKSVWRLPLS
jgi:hypothetical protein